METGLVVGFFGKQTGGLMATPFVVLPPAIFRPSCNAPVTRS
jgi:hypothetical protein